MKKFKKNNVNQKYIFSILWTNIQKLFRKIQNQKHIEIPIKLTNNPREVKKWGKWPPKKGHAFKLRKRSHHITQDINAIGGAFYVNSFARSKQICNYGNLVSLAFAGCDCYQLGWREGKAIVLSADC